MKPKTTSMSRSGFTLIELVVTIGILLVVAVIVIPSVRMLNEDRKVHDTARVVGAVFSAARERAAVDGSAGVEIVPLANASGGFNIPNMGMAVYQLRAIPPYNGDLADSTATVAPIAGAIGDAVIFGDLSATGANIRADDFIEFNFSGIHYRIVNVVTVTPFVEYTVMFEIGTHQPNPPATIPVPLTPIPVPFKIHRQPVRIESSVVRLPRNLFLNLAWSGYGMAGEQYGWNGGPPLPAANVSTTVWFNRDGSIDRATDRDNGIMERVDGPLYLLLCTGGGDDIDVTAPGAQRFIEDDNNLWIVVDHLNGGVSLGAIAELGTAMTIPEKITASRALAKNRRSTTP